MTTNGTYKLIGHIGSPYSMKMRAVMRYRRLSHTLTGDGRERMRAQSRVAVPVIPVLEYPDGSLRNDSTPLIFDLEARHPGERSIAPERESDAFLALLIEDLADEWLAKSMYFYRWFHPEHRKQTSEWIAYDMHFGGGVAALRAWAEPFRQRQADAVRALLEIAGEDSLPFLVANARESATGSPSVRHESRGLIYEPAPYRYQVKCLGQLRGAFSNLSAEAKREVEPLLEASGCLPYLADS